MLIIGVVFFGIFTMVSGPLAEKWGGRRKFLLGVTVGIFVFGALWFTMFGPRPGSGHGWPHCGGVHPHGPDLRPHGGHSSRAVPGQRPLHGFSSAYNLSSMIGAAPASFVAIALWSVADGSTWLVGATWQPPLWSPSSRCGSRVKPRTRTTRTTLPK